jgi:hypothetical protein
MYHNIGLVRFGLLALLVAALCSNASAGLVGHWKFDETSGSKAKDSSGQGNDGSVVGNPKWVAGKIGGALEFDGSTYVNCGNKPSLNVRDEVTMSFWFKVEAFQNGWEAFLAKGDGAYRASRSAETGNSVHMGVSSGNNFDATIIVTDNQWHHYAGTYDGAEARIYIDGTLQAQRAYSGPVGNSSSYSLFIGENSQATGRLLHGLLDDVRIYDKAMSEQQVLALIATGAEPTWLKAEKPDPADGAVGVGAPLLQWTKGETAVFHDVYIGTAPELGPEQLAFPRYPSTFFYYTVPLQPGMAYYWRVDEVERDGVTTHTGDVWSFVAQDLTAYYPSPANGANDAAPAPTLTWLPGQGAIKHHLYFSDSLDAVTQGAAEADQGELALADATFAPGDLESLKTYHWRVDETMIGGAIKTGPVWSFTTHLPIDDFESYNDDEGTGTRIYETWIDGWINGNGSTVGNFDPPFVELAIVHGGLQSMPMDYNNIGDPFYSEAVREFSPVQNWTGDEVDTLVLYVQGRLANRQARLYVKIEDSSQQVGTVVHPDPAVVTTAQWTTWRIPFTDLAGVNLSKVKKLYIGLGDRANPVAGGTGRIFIDDICLTKPAPAGQ